MKITITDLWNGNIDSSYIKLDLNEKEIIDSMEKCYDDLNSQLNHGEKEALRMFTDCYDELIACECKNAFVQGFSIAVRLMVESLT